MDAGDLHFVRWCNKLLNPSCYECKLTVNHFESSLIGFTILKDFILSSMFSPSSVGQRHHQCCLNIFSMSSSSWTSSPSSSARIFSFDMWSIGHLYIPNRDDIQWQGRLRERRIESEVGPGDLHFVLWCNNLLNPSCHECKFTVYHFESSLIGITILKDFIVLDIFTVVGVSTSS